jgi:hypothetical protein
MVKESQADILARNANIVREIDATHEGEIKNASAAGTEMLRLRIREEGFTRRIIPPKQVRNEDLDRAIDTDRPVMIEDMENDQPGAMSLPFGAGMDATFYYGLKYQCVFNEITTPEFTKDINELRTYKHDIRQLVTDNSLKDVQTQEDGGFIAGVDTIVGSSSGVGASGFQQNFDIQGGITRSNYRQILDGLEDLDLNNGIVLINRKTAKAWLDWGRDEMGGDLSQSLATDGLKALQDAQLFGGFK